MASSSYRQRSGSPFRFHKPASVDGTIPGLSHFLAPASSSSTHFSGSGRTRSLTPTRGRATSPALPSSTFKFKFGSPSLPSRSIGSGGSVSPTLDAMDFQQGAKENVSVTVRFRPLSLREIQRGDEVAWYADGDTTVRSEYNPATAYAFDRVFGPATTTRGVYDVAARHVVRGAMEGVNGTVFAYGVTSSGKTHTMHGDHKSPGIIPQAVKDVFGIIQDTPGREYLLRVSYLEIYNEVINDLLDPAGQNLRIREDSQGTYVEGVKEEVVLSPAHALSLIAAGEEHRHVGSNNFNLLSSRSHTIFTLTIESSSRTADYYEDEVTLSQLNLIDLAGSESSKTETTGLRRKEGSYINKSLLTLGTVIAKLSDGKASHVPYRDSKLTRLLQSSLSGHGRVSLICTLTPASSNIEETHNTLKFAYRAKRVAIHAAPNRIMDEKSLIKKYQKEISSLKQELAQVKRGIPDKPYFIGTTQEDLLILRQQLEAGQVKLQSRLEEEEQAKAALLGRIQRLTKLILVSTKNSTLSPGPEQQASRRRHSFGEEDLNSLGEKRRAFAFEFNDDSGIVGHDVELPSEGKMDMNGIEEIVKDEKKSKRRGMLAWFKLKKNEGIHVSSSMNLDSEISPNASPASAASGTTQLESLAEFKAGRRRSFSRKIDELTPVVDSFPEFTQAGELFSAAVHRRPPPSGETMADQMDLLREQVKMLAGEVAFCTSSLKRMSEQAAGNPDDVQLQAQMEKTKDEIQEKKRQIQVLEQRILKTGQAAVTNASPIEMSETISKLMGQLNEKEFELEIKSADNRILQEQLQTKISEINKLQETLHQQLTLPPEKKSSNLKKSGAHSHGLYKRGNFLDVHHQHNGGTLMSDDLQSEKVEAEGSDSESYSSKGSSRNIVPDPTMQNQLRIQAAEIENLKQEKVRLVEENGGLQIQSRKLAEEASYAKELASAAAVELKNLAEEVTKLSFENSKLVNDLATAQEVVFSRISSKPSTTTGYFKNGACTDFQTNSHFLLNKAERALINTELDIENETYDDIDSWKLDPEDIKRELHARKEKEASLEAALADREQSETELRKKLEEAKQREADLENDLAGMWVLVAKLKKEKGISEAHLSQDSQSTKDRDNCLEVHGDNISTLENNVHREEPDKRQRVIEDLQASLEEEKERSSELETLVSRLKSEKLEGLQLSALEELQNLHVEALTKICQAKARSQDREKGGLPGSLCQQEEEKNGHVCKVCFEAPTAAVLLPCRHFCLCKPCAVACTECPLCRSGIADRIITFTS